MELGTFRVELRWAGRIGPRKEKPRYGAPMQARTWRHA